MIPILEYITQVHNRSQKINYEKRTPYMDLVKDFMFDMKSNNLVFNSDEEVLEYLDNVIHEDIVYQAFCDFKRNYRAWFRRHNK